LRKFKKFLEDEDIARQLSVKYIPQQNGVVERINRTLVEMARYMSHATSEAATIAIDRSNQCLYILKK